MKKLILLALSLGIGQVWASPTPKPITLLEEKQPFSGFHFGLGGSLMRTDMNNSYRNLARGIPRSPNYHFTTNQASVNFSAGYGWTGSSMFFFGSELGVRFYSKKGDPFVTPDGTRITQLKPSFDFYLDALPGIVATQQLLLHAIVGVSFTSTKLDVTRLTPVMQSFNNDNHLQTSLRLGAGGKVKLSENVAIGISYVHNYAREMRFQGDGINPNNRREGTYWYTPNADSANLSFELYVD